MHFKYRKYIFNSQGHQEIDLARLQPKSLTLSRVFFNKLTFLAIFGPEMKVQGSIRGPQWKVNQGSIFRIVRNTIKIDLPGFQPKSLTSGRCFVEKTAFLGFFGPFWAVPGGPKWRVNFFCTFYHSLLSQGAFTF